MARSDKWTALRQTPTYYSDFDSNFTLNPQTGYLSVLTNAEAIINSIRNLVLTNKFERPYQPDIGSKIQSLLFDLNDPTTHNLLTTTIKETINNYEPRAQLVNVQVAQIIDENQIAITITFSMLNIPQSISFALILKRVR